MNVVVDDALEPSEREPETLPSLQRQQVEVSHVLTISKVIPIVVCSSLH